MKRILEDPHWVGLWDLGISNSAYMNISKLLQNGEKDPRGTPLGWAGGLAIIRYELLYSNMVTKCQNDEKDPRGSSLGCA